MLIFYKQMSYFVKMYYASEPLSILAFWLNFYETIDRLTDKQFIIACMETFKHDLRLFVKRMKCFHVLFIAFCILGLCLVLILLLRHPLKMAILLCKHAGLKAMFLT